MCKNHVFCQSNKMKAVPDTFENKAAMNLPKEFHESKKYKRATEEEDEQSDDCIK